MAGHSQFSIGGVPLDPRQVNTPFLRQMYTAVKNAEPTEGKAEALEALTELGKTGEVSSETFAAVDSFRKSVYTEWRSDKDRYWETWRTNGKNFKDPKMKAIEKEMGVGGEVLFKDMKLSDARRVATALAATAAVPSAAGGGPIPLVAAYEAYSNEREWSKAATDKTEAVMKTWSDYKQGDSRMITEGNSVKQVHRAELWKAIHDLTAEAKESGAKGKPLPITAQYYELTSPEMNGNLATAAKAGSKVRLNVDPGRLSYPSKDSKGNQYYDVDDIPDKMRTILQFTSLKGADIGVSIFPAKKELQDPTDLMHRKVLRVGDKVLISGMNTNDGSGENVDAGYVVQGPAATKFTENLRRDIQTSSGATLEDIWGPDHLELFKKADLRVGNRGLTAILDDLGGPLPAGQDLPKTKTIADLEALAKKAGVDLTKMFDVSADDYEKVVGGVASGRGKASLSAYGKEQLMAAITKAVDSTQTPKNLKALADVDLPSDKKVGGTRVDIGDLPAEREVLVLNAINEAKEFIYLPGFVVTRSVAAALVAKRDEMAKEGKNLDIKVVADAGIYPDGGSPNSWGVNYLEDNNVPVKWAKLTRTGSHDRKIHAKQLITDQGEIVGSTNFSKKGLQENWETSAYVHFDEKDTDNLRSQSKAEFLDLYNDDAAGLSVKDLAAYENRYAPAVGRDWTIEQDRNRQTRKVLSSIERYEQATAGLVAGYHDNPAFQAKYDSYRAEGYSEGDSALKAADDVIGKEKFRAERDALPANQSILETEQRVATWKAKYGPKDDAPNP